jgi:hypothetical protein
MRLRARAKILGGRDDASDGVVSELSQNDNWNDRAETAQFSTILNVGGIGEVAIRH